MPKIQALSFICVLLWLCPSIAAGQASVRQKAIAQSTPELDSKYLLKTTRKQCINMPIKFNSWKGRILANGTCYFHPSHIRQAQGPVGGMQHT